MIEDVGHEAVGWLDPAIESRNAGDAVISAAVADQLRSIGIRNLIRLPTRRPWLRAERRQAKACQLFVVGGTNLLTSHPLTYRQWRFGLRDLALLRTRCVLLGVGWWQYESRPDAASRTLLRLLLSQTALHGARDGYTAERLRGLGLNVRNTSCPTLWTARVCGETTDGFRSSIVATVTDYLPDSERDARMLQTLSERAASLRVWPQGSGDARYVEALGFGDRLLDPGLPAFERAINAPGAEYVGTRLHAGARALQFGVPSVVIGVDNRATEISRDIGLWLVAREDMDDLDEHLDALSSWHLTLPDADIASWKADLAAAVAQSGHRI